MLQGDVTLDVALENKVGQDTMHLLCVNVCFAHTVQCNAKRL